MGKFIALFSSREEKCSHIFSSTILEDTVVAPPTLIRECSSCKKNHTFYLTNRLLVSTPSQIKNYNTYAKKIGVIEYNVIVDI